MERAWENERKVYKDKVYFRNVITDKLFVSVTVCKNVC